MEANKRISELIPGTWDYILRKNKVLMIFYGYVKRDSPIKKQKLRGYFINVKVNIQQGILYDSILHCFNYKNTKEGMAFWEDINDQITNYNQLCR